MYFVLSVIQVILCAGLDPKPSYTDKEVKESNDQVDSQQKEKSFIESIGEAFWSVFDSNQDSKAVTNTNEKTKKGMAEAMANYCLGDGTLVCENVLGKCDNVKRNVEPKSVDKPLQNPGVSISEPKLYSEILSKASKEVCVKKSSVRPKSPSPEDEDFVYVG